MSRLARWLLRVECLALETVPYAEQEADVGENGHGLLREAPLNKPTKGDYLKKINFSIERFVSSMPSSSCSNAGLGFLKDLQHGCMRNKL